MITFPNIKINLGLRITSKREDGYHNIESCFCPIPWCDALEITDADQFSFESSGLPIPGESSSNLVVKAYEQLKKDFDLPPVKVHLLKSIPMGAGLGGGSADGAFMLKLLNEKFKLGLVDEQLEAYALRLGSDCPFFIKNQPVIAKGRGEVFEPINLSLAGKHVVLINPGLHIGTKEAYAGVVPHTPETELKELLEKTSIDGWKDIINNDFEVSAFKLHPSLQLLKDELYNKGALYASMSGSGSTIYGIFDSDPRLDMIDAYRTRTFQLE
ncbi:MAG: 4-(cytidine 5'-diphospho)-2-C-methyl-D-erythritol kinase [Cyclobacteriaceae bacterium]